MPDWVERELRSNFARASRAARLAAITQPRAARVAYRAQKHTLRIELTNGATIILPVKLIPSLKGVRATLRIIRTSLSLRMTFLAEENCGLYSTWTRVNASQANLPAIAFRCGRAHRV